MEYKLTIVDETGHEHVKLEMDGPADGRGNQEHYMTMLIYALDNTTKLLEKEKRDKWERGFDKLLEEIEA